MLEVNEGSDKVLSFQEAMKWSAPEMKPSVKKNEEILYITDVDGDLRADEVKREIGRDARVLIY